MKLSLAHFIGFVVGLVFAPAVVIAVIVLIRYVVRAIKSSRRKEEKIKGKNSGSGRERSGVVEKSATKGRAGPVVQERAELDNHEALYVRGDMQEINDEIRQC